MHHPSPNKYPRERHMTKLTNFMREQIKNAAVESIFEPKRKVIKKWEHKLAQKCYNSIYPLSLRKQADAMPKEWIRRDQCLRFNANGWTVELYAEEVLPVPHSAQCRILGAVTGELGEEVQKYSQDWESHKRERTAAGNKLRGFLTNFNTFKQLREGWPEGKKFYQAHDAETAKVPLPAIITQEINNLLGLKTNVPPSTLTKEG